MSDLTVEGKHQESEKAAVGTHNYGRNSGSESPIEGGADVDKLVLKQELGYEPESHLVRNRSLLTLLFQSLAIAAIPYGEGGPLLSAIYGGGQLSIFLGWIVVCILNECVAISLAELASRWPTSAGPSYWSFQLLSNSTPSARRIAAYATGWTWIIGNITIALSVNFGFASLIASTVTLFHPDFTATSWQLLLIFYAICLGTLLICAVCNRHLPMVDTFCAAFTLITIFVCLIALSAKADVGRHSAAYALGHYDKSLAGYGGFTWFIGLLPAAYTFSAIGMISSMAEECRDAAVKLPQAISLCVPVGGLAGIFFILPICFTLPPLEDIVTNAGGQALPYIFEQVMGSPGGGLGLIVLVLVVTAFCSISITTAASRATWAFARDDAIPGARWWAVVNKSLGVPLYSLILVTIVQMLLGLINLGSTSAFTAFVSVGVMALNLSYMIPIALSMVKARTEVDKAKFKCPSLVGWIVNAISCIWITFELVLFSMPTALPVTAISMNYASVVLVGLGSIALLWYFIHARRTYKGPPEAQL